MTASNSWNRVLSFWVPVASSSPAEVTSADSSGPMAAPAGGCAMSVRSGGSHGHSAGAATPS